MKQYRTGDILVYDVNGICRVTDIKKLSFVKGEPKQDYYVLVPITGTASQFYVPVGNERAVSKLRKPFTKEELDKVLSQVKNGEYQWIENRQLRSETFHSVLDRGVTADLVALIECLYCRKEALKKKGKRLSTTDESIFSAAEKLLNEEFAFVLGVEREEVSNYIVSYFNSKE